MSTSASRNEPALRSKEPDRREYFRGPAQRQTYGYLRCEGNREPWAMEIRNLSPAGISIIIGRRIEEGRVVCLDLHNGPRRFHCEKSARVIYRADLPGEDNLLGCEFVEKLTPEEARALIESHTPN